MAEIQGVAHFAARIAGKAMLNVVKDARKRVARGTQAGSVKFANLGALSEVMSGERRSGHQVAHFIPHIVAQVNPFAADRTEMVRSVQTYCTLRSMASARRGERVS